MSSPRYEGINTPRQLGGRLQKNRNPVILFLQALVILCMGMFLFGNIATWAPLFEIELVNTMMGWWNGYPNNGGAVTQGHYTKVIDTGLSRNITISGHTEFIRPTFLMLFCIIPFLFSLLLIEILRYVNHTQRVACSGISFVSQFLRRKPWIPAFGVSKYTLGEWIFGIVFVLGGNCLCFYYEWDRRINLAKHAVAMGTGKLDTTKYFNIVGISFAYLCIYNMAFLLLPVSRNSAWMEFFNISYSNASKLHRWIGYATVITGVVHTGGYWGKWIRDGTFMANQMPCIHCDFTNESTGYYAWFNVFGFISVLALVLLIPTSLPIVRRKAYEWFYLTHWTLFVIALIFAILHWSQIIWWILPSALVYYISRATSSWNGLAPVPDAELRVIEDTIVQIALYREPATSNQYDYKVGNFVYVNVPHISKLQWHPLTVASAPTSNSMKFVLYAKPLGDWSFKLKEYANECSSGDEAPIIYMDGFYGSSLEVYTQYSTLLLVGGGIGVTPILAVLEDIANHKPEPGEWSQTVVVVLTFRDIALLQIMAPVLERLRELDPSHKQFRTHIFVSSEPSEGELEKKLNISNLTITKPKSSVIRAFREPLRSSILMRCTLYIVLFAVATFVVGAMRWGNGAIQGDDNPQLWPLQRFSELAVFTATIVIVYIFIWYEFTMTKKQHENANDSGLTPCKNQAGLDHHTLQDVISDFNVAIGVRPDMQELLKETLMVHNTQQSTGGSIGTIVSGPNTLKQATNEAAIKLGASNFDIHEEEFEL